MAKAPKYPETFVQLSGEDGNSGAVMARVARALKRDGISGDEIAAFRREVFDAHSYDHVLRIVMNWVEVG